MYTYYSRCWRYFPGINDINKVTALSGGPAGMEVDYVRVFQK